MPDHWPTDFDDNDLPLRPEIDPAQMGPYYMRGQTASKSVPDGPAEAAESDS